MLERFLETTVSKYLEHQVTFIFAFNFYGKTNEYTFPLKWRIFFDAEIFIYSRAEFLIYLFEDFIQKFSNETPCQ